MSYLGNRNFRITLQVSYTGVPVINMTVCLLWETKLFGSHLGSLTPMFQAFHLMGLTVPFLLRLTHIIHIFFSYDLNHESFIGRRPKYELTTHSSTLMMDDHTHAHTPNMLMSLCICNANVTAISHVTCIMHTTLTIFISCTSCQLPCKHISQVYKFHIFHANIYIDIISSI